MHAKLNYQVVQKLVLTCCDSNQNSFLIHCFKVPLFCPFSDLCLSPSLLWSSLAQLIYSKTSQDVQKTASDLALCF